MTRIIAGSARGRRLAVPPAGTRPTSDRVREAVFSSIESDLLARGVGWSQVVVLDLFAGTGAFGLEALSRGASGAAMVEKSRSAARVLEANLAAVGCPGGNVLVRDARQLASAPPMVEASLCFADPPYEWSARDLKDVLTLFAETGWIRSGALVIAERPGKDAESPLPDAAIDVRRRPYGDTALWYGRFEGQGQAQPRPPENPLR